MDDLKNKPFYLDDAELIWLDDIYNKLNEKLSAQAGRLGSIIPYIPQNGSYNDIDTQEGIYMWTNGFWTGILWQMFYATNIKLYADTAKRIEERLDDALNGFEGLYHDVGFMYSLSAVADYRITGSKEAKIRGLHAAAILAGRYNPAGEFIRAWNQPSWTKEDVSGWAIIDSMMNLSLLYWAGDETGDPRFREIARRHADTILRFCLRGDGSSNHIIVLDPATGEYIGNPRGQGYASGSSWSRGQSWALYGFTLAYKYMGDEKFLNAAKNSANYCIANLALEDWLPVVDFRAPKHSAKYDSTAGMSIAAGLFELAEHVGEYEKKLYFRAAVKILKACEKKFCNWNTAEDGIVNGGTVLYHSRQNADVPIIYGDYFLVESILHLKNKQIALW